MVTKKALFLSLTSKERKEIYSSRNFDYFADNFDAFITRINANFMPKKNVSYKRYVLKILNNMNLELYQLHYTIKNPSSLV